MSRFLALVFISTLILNNRLSGQTTAAELASEIRNQPQTPARGRGATPLQQAFKLYGANIKAAPNEIKAASLDFLKRTTLDKQLTVPRDPMHGSNRQFERDYSIALSMADNNNSIAVRSAVALAKNPTVSLALRADAVGFLEDNDIELNTLGTSLLEISKSRSSILASRNDRAIALRAFARMKNLSSTGKAAIEDEVSSSTLGIEDSLIPNIATSQLTASKLDLLLSLVEKKTNYAEVILSAASDAKPELLGSHAKVLETFANDSGLTPNARSFAVLSLYNAGKQPDRETVIKLFQKVEDEQLQIRLLNSLKSSGNLSPNEQSALKDAAKSESVSAMIKN